MKAEGKLGIITLALLVLLGDAGTVYPDTIDEMDRRASEYYERKEFTKALAEWLRILEIDPNNENAQKRIELLYEEKHRKDLGLQKAKYHYRLASDALRTDVKSAKINSVEAVDNFVIAYRIDPMDPELQAMKDDMRKLQEEVRVEQARQRLSKEMQEKYYSLLDQAQKKMDARQFDAAIKDYKEALYLVPGDITATEGIRNAKLAIENRLKYEKIQAYMLAGIALFNDKKMKESRVEFEQVLAIDPGNTRARRYVRQIDDILEARRNDELKRIQAEQFYVSGVENVKNKNFDQAVDDFENVLSIIPDYKDAREKLRNIDAYRKEYAEELRIQRLKTIDREFQNGLLAYANGKYREALSYFEKTLRLDKENELAKVYIVRVKDALKDVEEEVVDADSPYFDLINSLIVSGRQLYDRKLYTESRKRWERILQIFPKNRIAQEYLLKCDFMMNPGAYKEFAGKIVDEGKTLLREKNYSQAMKKFELVKSVSPDYPEINELIAAAKKGGPGKVAAGVSPAEIEMRYNQGMNLVQKGGTENYRKARDTFRWIIARDPNNEKALINLNRVDSQLRLGGAVVEEPRGALTEKQRQMVRTYYYNGISYYTNGNYDRALEEWRKVLAIDPTHERARNNIRKIIVLLGR